MCTHRSTYCSRNMELDNVRSVSKVCDSRRNNLFHLHHDIGDYQRCRPHKGHELRRGGGNKRPCGLNARVHEGRLRLTAKGCI